MNKRINLFLSFMCFIQYCTGQHLSGNKNLFYQIEFGIAKIINESNILYYTNSPLNYNALITIGNDIGKLNLSFSTGFFTKNYEIYNKFRTPSSTYLDHSKFRIKNISNLFTLGIPIANFKNLEILMTKSISYSFAIVGRSTKYFINSSNLAVDEVNINLLELYKKTDFMSLVIGTQFKYSFNSISRNKLLFNICYNSNFLCPHLTTHSNPFSPVEC